MSNFKQSKRFVISKRLIGKNQLIQVNFANGNVVKYNHDLAYEIMKEKLDVMPCFIKYKSYTSSKALPMPLRNVDILGKVEE